MPNHFMSVSDISKALNLRENLLYGWAAADKIPKKKGPTGIMLLSMDAVKEKSKQTLTKKHVVKAAPKRKRRPATKQADKLVQSAAVLEIFFPEGIPVKQYVNALMLAKAVDAVAP